ncbi:MAG: restriction endonuclease subunit S [Sandaracinaceae bacterium]
MARSRRAKEALDAIPPLLERFRQSVLAAAFRGDLTADWRAQNPDVEPADQLLERIRVERRRRWEEDYLKKQRAKGKEPKNDKWKAKYKEAEPAGGVHRLFRLPADWTWALLGEVATVIDPNPSHRYPSYDGGTVPLLSTREFAGQSSWQTESAPLVPHSFWVFQEERCRFDERDIVFARKGRLGFARRLPAVRQFTFSHTMFVVKPEPPLGSEYLLWYLRRPEVVAYLLREMNSNTGVPTLGKAFLERLPVPLPPRTEQSAIAARVRGIDARAECVGDAAEDGRRVARTLDAAVLAKAFRGELVPQDPNDEPASVLLERIRAQRQAEKPKNKPRRKRGS